MAISSFKAYLMYKSGNAYTKLIDIKDYPDLGGAPESLDTTTLSDPMHTYIPGIQDTEALTFTANYTAADFATVDALKDTDTDFAVWFGATESGGVYTPDGSDGKFEFTGRASVYVNGAGVNEVVNMTITIMPSTVITKA